MECSDQRIRGEATGKDGQNIQKWIQNTCGDDAVGGAQLGQSCGQWDQVSPGKNRKTAHSTNSEMVFTNLHVYTFVSGMSLMLPSACFQQETYQRSSEWQLWTAQERPLWICMQVRKPHLAF